MTLVVALQGKDGLVLAADSRGTIGDPRGLTAINDFQQKLFQLSKYCVALTYGQAELAAQLVAETKNQLTDPESELPLEFIDKVLPKAREVVRAKYHDWFSSFPIDHRPPVGFILAGYEVYTVTQEFEPEFRPRIYYLSSQLDFAPQLCTAGFALGGIPQYATYLVHRLYSAEMNIKQLARLAVYIILETASQDPKVGGPIQVAEITVDKGYKKFEDSEIQKIVQGCEKLHQAIRKVFVGEK